MCSELQFWEQPENVERFATRETDHRLLELLDGFANPGRTRTLDLGCAGGRNTVALAERGYSVRAIDASHAMVEKTRQRLASIVGPEEARWRVMPGSMSDLTCFTDDFFHLIVALGIYHNARSFEEWEAALAETARVLAPGGRLLVAVFTPETDLTGKGIKAVPDETHVYSGFPSGRAVLVGAPLLDSEMARYGLSLVMPSRTVTVRTETGRRVTVNALYKKQ